MLEPIEYENPNEYDDAAYTEAIVELQGNVPAIIRKCWEAGGSIDNLEDELSNAFVEAEIGLENGRSVVVSITVT